jgi:signal transduction histidine kinase/ActR/RegA family two-component response regulator
MALLTNRSLRQKLTLVALVTVIAAQVCAAIVLIGVERGRARRSVITGLEALSRIVVDNTAAAVDFGDPDAATDMLRSLGAQEGFERACLYDHDRRLFATFAVSGSCDAAPVPDGASFGLGVAYSAPVVSPQRGRVGTLTLWNSLSPVNDQLRQQIATMLIVLLLSSLAAVMLMARLQRQLTAPLQNLASTVAAVSNDRDYSRRVTKEGNDEVGELADAVNDMLLQIQHRDDELLKALRLKDEFLATVSHELRTPLNAMLGWSHVLRNPHLTRGTTEQAVQAIDRNARMQARLIEDILDVSRIVTGKLGLDPKPTDLVVIIRSAIDVVQPSAAARRIAIQHTLPQTAPFMGDPDRLRQVVWNLLSNAVKFTPPGGEVRVMLDEPDLEYRIAVVDSGQGISAEFLPFIFQPFRQADGSSTRTHGGLGLGLAIARHLTELSGGTIHADSGGAGQGATFSIRLPRAIPLQAGAIAEEPTQSDGWIELDGRRVLVVDDNDDTRSVLTTLLEAHGARVSTAASVAAARAALEIDVPDVLVTDLAMPVEDGYSLLDYCRQNCDPRIRRLPMLALTAYGGEQAETRVRTAGFDAYLAKPAEPAEVGRIVRELSARSRTLSK